MEILSCDLGGRQGRFSEEDEQAYAEAVKDFEKGDYVDMEDYLKERGLRV